MVSNRSAPVLRKGSMHLSWPINPFNFLVNPYNLPVTHYNLPVNHYNFHDLQIHRRASVRWKKSIPFFWPVDYYNLQVNHYNLLADIFNIPVNLYISRFFRRFCFSLKKDLAVNMVSKTTEELRSREIRSESIPFFWLVNYYNLQVCKLLSITGRADLFNLPVNHYNLLANLYNLPVHYYNFPVNVIIYF